MESIKITIYFCFFSKNMDKSLVIISSCFLFVYAVNVCINGIDKLYNIAVDIEDREEEKEEKNKMPESVKHLYS